MPSVQQINSVNLTARQTPGVSGRANKLADFGSNPGSSPGQAPGALGSQDFFSVEISSAGGSADGVAMVVAANAAFVLHTSDILERLLQAVAPRTEPLHSGARR